MGDDEAKTFSDGQRCIDPAGYYVMNNDRLVQTTDVVDNRPDLVFVGDMNITSGSIGVDEAVVGESLVLRVTVMNDGYTPAMSVKIRFDAIDTDSFVTNLGTVSRDFDANQTKVVEMP